jgi:SAM-dependent methyltransferase
VAARSSILTTHHRIYGGKRNGVSPISLQQGFWNQWNESREKSLEEVSRRQARVICGWLDALGRKDLDIIDVGCGAGWLCWQLTQFGGVTGTDLADEVLARAQSRTPEVSFVPGDFMKLDFGLRRFDVVVTLEVLSHVADQRAFVSKLASLLRPGGHLMLATQNRLVLKHLNFIPPPAPGQLRRWVDRHELQGLLEPEFEILELFSVTPKMGRGLAIRQRMGSKGLDSHGRAAVGACNGEPAPPAADRSGRNRLRRWVTERLEAAGLGWTLMALARRRIPAGVLIFLAYLGLALQALSVPGSGHGSGLRFSVHAIPGSRLRGQVLRSGNSGTAIGDYAGIGLGGDAGAVVALSEREVVAGV